LKVCVFLGPTLATAQAKDILNGLYFPPVAQGDLYAVARAERPHLIAIIDGYFESTPSVWHKEILWALSQGIHVLGSSSMGALRAAELATFGMEGVGKVFEALASGELEDDDEVAVVHGPAESGYMSLSEALVNIRFTLRSAVNQGVLSTDTRDALVALGKATYYPQRSWPSLLETSRESAASTPERLRELNALEAWLATGKIDQKRADAETLLWRIRDRIGPDSPPKSVRFHFQHTDSWEQLRRLARHHPVPSITDPESDDATSRADATDDRAWLASAVLDELRLLGPTYSEVREQTLNRALALEVADQRGLDIRDVSLDAFEEQLRRQHDLLHADDFEQWIVDQGLAGGQWRRALRAEAKIQHVRALAENDLERDMPSQLKIKGRFHGLAERAEAKHRRLETLGGQPQLHDIDLDESELWAWYFEQQMDMAIPENLQAYALALDFDGIDGLRWAVLREYRFVHPIVP